MAIGSIDPSPEACPASDVLAEYLERRLHSRDRAAVEAHLLGCADCRSVLTDAAADLEADGQPVSRWPGIVSFWRGKPALAVAGTLAAAAAIVLLLRVDGWNGSPSATPGQIATAPFTPDGNQAPLSRLASADADVVRRTLATMQLEVPPAVLALGGRRSVLRGGESATAPRLLDPLATYVSSVRPRFQWEPADNAQFEVTVFDAAGRPAATSQWITDPHWVPAGDLTPGASYTWQLAVKRGSDIIRTPTLVEPEARFQILTADAAREVIALRQKTEDAPVVAAILMARTGLLAEAEALLTETTTQPGSSDTARQLLAQLQSIRRGEPPR